MKMLQSATWDYKKVKANVFAAAKRVVKYASASLRDPALAALFGFSQTGGIKITEDTAMTCSAYYSGVNLISSTMGMLDIECVKIDPTTKEQTVDEQHVSNHLFSIAPNAVTIPYALIELVQSHAITWGNGYIWIERSGYDGVSLASNKGIPKALWPLMPDQMRPDWDEDGNKVYRFTKKFPGDSKDAVYPARDIIHITGFSFDGLRGYSVVELARTTLRLALGAEKFGSEFFENSAIPGGIITHPSHLDEKAKVNISEEVEDKVRGPGKQRRIVVLDEGMKYIQVGIPPQDAQFLQVRQFQVVEIARWLRIPPHLLYELQSATLNNIETLGIEYLTYTLGPWLTKWQQELRIKLLTVAEQKDHTFRFNTKRLLMMESGKRMEYYKEGRNMGLFNLNQIAQMEGSKMLPDDVGELHISPSTMRVLGSADPSTPIPPETIDKVVATLTTLKPDKQLAVAVCNATMPGATDEFIELLVSSLQSQKIVGA